MCVCVCTAKLPTILLRGCISLAAHNPIPAIWLQNPHHIKVCHIKPHHYSVNVCVYLCACKREIFPWILRLNALNFASLIHSARKVNGSRFSVESKLLFFTSSLVDFVGILFGCITHCGFLVHLIF